MQVRNISIQALSLVLTGLITHTAFALPTLTQVAAQATQAQNKTKIKRTAPVLTTPTSQPMSGKIVLQLGGFSAYQGTNQNISIQNSFEDKLSVTQHNGQDVLVGLGIFLDKPSQTNDTYPGLSILSTMYGVNMFYFPKTSVKGKIIRSPFNNSTYRYTVANFPIYLATKTIFKNCNDKYNFTLDFGLGPNVIRADYFTQKPVDGGTALPDNPYSGHTKVVVSAMAGVGVQFNNVFKDMPVECGYRIFYLGQGHLTTNNNNVTSTFYTGNSYANALLCSVTV